MNDTIINKSKEEAVTLPIKLTKKECLIEAEKSLNVGRALASCAIKEIDKVNSFIINIFTKKIPSFYSRLTPTTYPEISAEEVAEYLLKFMEENGRSYSYLILMLVHPEDNWYSYGKPPTSAIPLYSKVLDILDKNAFYVSPYEVNNNSTNKVRVKVLMFKF
jgi:hypothetical protein